MTFYYLVSNVVVGRRCFFLAREYEVARSCCLFRKHELKIVKLSALGIAVVQLMLVRETPVLYGMEIYWILGMT